MHGNSTVTPQFISRFWDKVQKADGCWLWTAALFNSGYGCYWHMKAHRVAWELTNGPIPDGLWVLHKCDTPACVRPDHLFLGTHADNDADKIRKLRHSYGEKSGRAKLTEANVRAIRALHPTVGGTALAKQFGVSYFTIWDIVKRRSWRHI